MTGPAAAGDGCAQVTATVGAQLPLRRAALAGCGATTGVGAGFRTTPDRGSTTGSVIGRAGGRSGDTGVGGGYPPHRGLDWTGRPSPTYVQGHEPMSARNDLDPINEGVTAMTRGEVASWSRSSNDDGLTRSRTTVSHCTSLTSNVWRCMLRYGGMA